MTHEKTVMFWFGIFTVIFFWLCTMWVLGSIEKQLDRIEANQAECRQQ